MITDLLPRAYREDIELWVESGNGGDRLLSKFSGTLPDDFRRELKTRKTEIIALILQNQKMKQAGWLCFEFGACYMRTLHVKSSLVAQRNEKDTFILWRGTWNDSKPAPIYQSVLVNNATYDVMFQKAQNYLDRFGSRRG